MALLAPPAAAPLAQDVFAYPSKGQSQEQQDKDNFECHRWAKDQSGFDPGRAPQALSPPPREKSTGPGALGGAAGMLVGEMDLVGIVKDQGGNDMGLLIGSDNKGYFLRVGDSVFDGTVIAVDSRLGTVTFRQQVDDPRVIKPYRDVVKRLVPEDEESEE